MLARLRQSVDTQRMILFEAQTEPDSTARSDDVRPERPCPGQASPDKAYPGQAYPGQAFPGKAYPGQACPGQAGPDQAGPDQVRPGPVRRVFGPAYAALDLGTNNCRMLVGTPSGDGFKVLDSFSRIVRLGEGLHSTGRLNEAAMDRAVLALQICAARLARRQLRQVRAVATEACRRATNGAAFLCRVKQETGFDFGIISSREEAELALEFLHAAAAVRRPAGAAVRHRRRLDRTCLGAAERWAAGTYRL